MGETFLTAYTEYLERVFLDSDELTRVDPDSVPEDVYLPCLEEWATLY